MKTKLALAALLAAGAAALAPVSAQAGAKVGTLVCRSQGTVNQIITSSETVLCRYTPFGRLNATETYVGTLDTYGVDLGITGKTISTWSVLAASFQRGEPMSLAGRYYGASVDAGYAVSVGAKALIGGPDRGFTLQPTSLQIGEGVNATVGVARLTLQEAEPVAVVYKP
ncbi:DUF992 domain-containing protein [Aureimonas jatrophae]|uniref:DUF992 domain-containing protein n=1 Tax=Aureimonas jatrophae TaxID=1166073 RepID=A0A1H0J7Y0_9HYPH|nr:DUF992 domain-containing protein [Aureimonas jatrophae]MBB3951555.1 hypothetical protein [Aureimonas jatrophae]SDO39640.1 Protein of unknown function [Aureimonas jatrophae]